MGDLVRRLSEAERRRLPYALLMVGALVVVAVCLLWHGENPSTPRAALLIVGCELAIVGVGIQVLHRTPAEPDLPPFICRCLVEAIFGAAFVCAAVIATFGATKPTDRLGYVLAALVVVPSSVVLSCRFSGADRLGRSRPGPVILLALTTVAIVAARAWGPGHVSLRLLLFLAAARTLDAVVSRTRVTGDWPRVGARPFAVMPLILAGAALAFAPADQLTFGHLMLGIAAGLLIGVGWGVRRSLVAPRAVRHSIDAIAVLACVLVVFQLGLPDVATALNGNYFLGPADDILHGHPMLIDTYSQYGVGMFDALAGVFSILPFGYGDLQLLLSTLTALEWVAIYAVVRMGTKSQLMAILAVAVGIPIWVFNPYGVFTDYPSTGVLRFGMPWLVVLLSVASARIGPGRPRRYLDAAVLVIVAVGAEWSGETGIYCLGAGCAIAWVNGGSISASLRQRVWVSVRSSAQLIGAYLLGLLLFTVITRVTAGSWPDWGPYGDFLRLYTAGGLGAQEINSWSPGLAVGGIYAASAAVIVGVVAVRPDAVRERLSGFRAAAGLTAMGPLVYTYFLGRANPSNLIWVSPPFVALVFVWLGIASASFDARLPATAMVVSVTFLAGFVLASLRPVITAGFRSTALYALLHHPREIRSELGTIKDNPVVLPQAVALEDYVDSLHIDHRSLTILVLPALQSEALFRLGRANAVGTSNPCQEELSQTGASRVLAGVRDLRPGGVLVTADGPTYGPLLTIQRYTLRLLEDRFDLRRIAPAAGGLIAYTLREVRPNWHGGASIAKPAADLLGAQGCA